MTCWKPVRLMLCDPYEGIHSTIGASVGLGVGLFLSLRLRRAGAAIYNAAKRVEKPTHLQFADGHTGKPHYQYYQSNSGLCFSLTCVVPFPDTSEYFRPSTAGQILTGFLFSVSGFFLFGEIGLITGAASANRAISADPDARCRIERAFRSFRIDVLRSQADQLEQRGQLTTGATSSNIGEPKLV